MTGSFLSSFLSLKLHNISSIPSSWNPKAPTLEWLPRSLKFLNSQITGISKIRMTYATISAKLNLIWFPHALNIQPLRVRNHNQSLQGKDLIVEVFVEAPIKIAQNSFCSGGARGNVLSNVF